VRHIQQSEIQPQDDGQEHMFLQKHLLHWLEALSLMGKASEGVIAISSLESYIQVSCINSRLEASTNLLLKTSTNPNLYAFIHDAKRFALRHRSVIEYTPLQIYSSALIFTPENRNKVTSSISDLAPMHTEHVPLFLVDLITAVDDGSGLEQCMLIPRARQRLKNRLVVTRW
jgi:hypothetical protein